MIEDKIKSTVRDVVDFPKKGILFKDITPILEDPNLSKEIIKELAQQVKHLKIDAVIGVESRGFLFGPSLAMELNVPFILARKKGKLPYKTIQQSYDLEYGEAIVEVNQDCIQSNWNVLIHDDLLATGGTAEAIAKIIQKEKAQVVGFAFMIELIFLNGRQILEQYSSNIVKLASY